MAAAQTRRAVTVDGVDEAAIRREMAQRVREYYGLSPSQREAKRAAERALDKYQLRERERYVIPATAASEAPTMRLFGTWGFERIA